MVVSERVTPVDRMFVYKNGQPSVNMDWFKTEIPKDSHTWVRVHRSSAYNNYLNKGNIWITDNYLFTFQMPSNAQKMKLNCFFFLRNVSFNEQKGSSCGPRKRAQIKALGLALICIRESECAGLASAVCVRLDYWCWVSIRTSGWGADHFIWGFENVCLVMWPEKPWPFIV